MSLFLQWSQFLDKGISLWRLTPVNNTWRGRGYEGAGVILLTNVFWTSPKREILHDQLYAVFSRKELRFFFMKVTYVLGVGTMSPNRSRLSILNAYGVKWNLLKRFFDISNPQLTPALPTQPGAEPVRGLHGQNWRELSFRATGLKFGSIDLWS